MSFIFVTKCIDLFISLPLDCNSVKFDYCEISSLYSDNYYRLPLTVFESMRSLIFMFSFDKFTIPNHTLIYINGTK